MDDTEIRSASGRFWRWPVLIAALQRRPGQWAVRLNDQPHRLLRTVRKKQHPALRLDDGVIHIAMVLSYVDPNGHRRGDMYLMYEPYDSGLG